MSADVEPAFGHVSVSALPGIRGFPGAGPGAGFVGRKSWSPPARGVLQTFDFERRSTRPRVALRKPSQARGSRKATITVFNFQTAPDPGLPELKRAKRNHRLCSGGDAPVPGAVSGEPGRCPRIPFAPPLAGARELRLGVAEGARRGGLKRGEPGVSSLSSLRIVSCRRPCRGNLEEMVATLLFGSSCSAWWWRRFGR